MEVNYGAPEPLQSTHDLAGFDCGEPSLNNWLLSRAGANTEIGASRTYVTTAGPQGRVCGYYSLSMGHLVHTDVASKYRRNMPDPIPCALIGRLAVDLNHQGLGLGLSMLQNAVLRAHRAAQYVAARFVMVHALDENAAKFYLRHGFVLLKESSQAYGLDLTLISRNK